jgi:cation:H+ antiporter
MSRDLLMLLGGLVLIVKGGDWFVGAAVRAAELLRMPRAVVGSTLVSLATTTPELVVSIMAATKGEPGLAVGNAVGSCICNIGLILGTTAAIRTVTLQPAALARPLRMMFAASLALLVFTFDFRLGRAGAGVLLAAGVFYFVWDFLHHLRRRDAAQLAQAAAIEEAAERRFAWLLTPLGTAGQFLGAAGVVVIGSRLLVDGAVGLATALGIPSLVIGLTIVAIGTSLPEFITAITSSRKAVSDLAVGNVLGANIANLTLIVGTAGLLQEVTLGRDTHFFHFPVMLSLMGLLFWRLARDRRLSRRDGWTLIGVYAAYLLIVVTVTAFD